MKDVVYGLIGGIVGALLWAGVVYLTEYEIGWIAWGVGGMVGYAVAQGNKDGSRSPRAAGTVAVIITVLSIVAGKYAAVLLIMPSDVEIVELFTAGFEDEEYVISYLADDVVQDFETSGRTVAWPADVDPTTASGEADYPVDVWEEAMGRWAVMTADEHAAFREEREAGVREDVEANMPAIRAAMNVGGFLGSFSPMDLIFFGLGTVTAFSVGSGKKSEEEDAEAVCQRAVKLAMLRVMMADGSMDQAEVLTVVAVYQRLTGDVTTPEAIRYEATVARSSDQDLLSSLSQLAPVLSEAGKETVVRSALMVAIADGNVGEEERLLVEEIATAMGMPREQLTRLLTDVVAAS